MKYLKKLSFVFLALTLIFGACDDDTYLTITPPEAAFTLQTPGISNIFLNFSLPDNPAVTMSWNDDVTGASSYTVEMSLENTFATSVALGTTNTNSFSISVSDLNDAIRSAGATNFVDVAMYVRVSTGSATSNTVLYLVTTYPMDAPAFNGLSDGDAFVLALVNNNDEAVNVMWNDPVLDSSLGVDVTYYLEAAAPNTSFATVVDAGNVTNMNSISLTNSQLNAVAINTGIAVDTAGDVEMRIRSVITDTNTGAELERISDSVTINVTTYLTVLDLSTTWGIVGSAANDWGNGGPDLPFWQTDTPGVLAAYVHLIDGEMKFRENNDWTLNYGDNGADGTLEENGANIAVTEGDYKVTFDLNNLTYTVEPFSVGIVGSGYNDWGNGGPDFMLQYDQYSDVFRGIVTLLDGEIKFRMNNDWGTNYGVGGTAGSLALNGGNIASTAGIYIVTVDLNNLEYSLEQIDSVWGVVGSGYNDWGNGGPDASFTRDWSRPFNDIWILEGVTLLDGEIKFRANNDWGVNYGDNGGDGTLELNGGNIPSTAGTYNIELDFSDPNNPTWTYY